MKQKFFFLLIVLVSFTSHQVEGHSLPTEICDDDDASFFMTPTCDGATATITGDPGGTFAFNPEPTDLAEIDAATGTVINATPGVTYTVEYTTAGPSPETSYQNFSVPIGDSSFFMTPTCNGATATVTGDVGGVFNFNPTPADGIVIDSVTGTVTGGTSGATYYVEYTTSGECQVSSIEEFTVLLSEEASFFMTPVCNGAYATITGVAGGTFAFNPLPTDGATIDSDTGMITTGVGGATYVVMYTTSGACAGSSIEIVTIDCIDAVGFIEVNAFIDENTNTIFDASELNFNEGVFSYEINDDGIINYVNSSYGSFIIPIAEEGDTYDISFVMDEGYESCLSQTFDLVENVTATSGDTVQVNFPIIQIDGCNDIAVYLTSYISPRPGVVHYYTLIVENLGILPASGSVEFTHDPLLTFLSVSNLGAGNSITPTATGFVLNYNDLQPFELEGIIIFLDVPESAMAGDLLTSSAVYNVSDLNLENNESTLTQTVVNSYDPNDKAESHGPKIKFEDFTEDDYLFYTIRFQNLGTAEAIDIRVEDVLDAQLDASTFKMLHSSHDYVVTRVDNNLTWEFDDIDLPSESMDEPNSHGYVYFKIKPTTGYAVDDIIPNFADIYFDFNPAVTTNTFETEFVENLSVDEFSSTSFSMFPNPANDELHINLNNSSEKIIVSIYDIQGKVLLTINSKDQESIILNLSTFANGMYFVKVNDGERELVKKLIIE